jgi:hypothetical protein
MNIPPSVHDLDPHVIENALADAWHLPQVRLEYQRIGFGSHDWLARAVDGQ